MGGGGREGGVCHISIISISFLYPRNSREIGRIILAKLKFNDIERGF